VYVTPKDAKKSNKPAAGPAVMRKNGKSRLRKEIMQGYITDIDFLLEESIDSELEEQLREDN
jgi:hypothetical protein